MWNVCICDIGAPLYPCHREAITAKAAVPRRPWQPETWNPTSHLETCQVLNRQALHDARYLLKTLISQVKRRTIDNIRFVPRPDTSSQNDFWGHVVVAELSAGIPIFAYGMVGPISTDPCFLCVHSFMRMRGGGPAKPRHSSW